MADDPYSDTAPGPQSGGRRGRVVTPSDTEDLPTIPKAVVLLSAGNVAILPVNNDDDEPLAFVGVHAGCPIVFQVRRVLATGTTATVATIED
ncbi:hypothetical protein ACVILI_004342 [Mesorhizobium sp. USDA 4775]